MGSVYVARLKNARRIGHALKRLQKAGCIIVDDEGQLVNEPVRLKGFSGDVGLSVGCTVYFTSDMEFDNGMHTPISEFNERFTKWRAFHPNDAKPLIEGEPDA